MIIINGRSTPHCPNCETAKAECIRMNEQYNYNEIDNQLLETLQSKYPMVRSLPIVEVIEDGLISLIGSLPELKEYLKNKQGMNLLCESGFTL